MKKLYVYPCLLATLVMPVFAGISVTSPTNGAQVQSSVHYVATAQSPACAKGVAAIGIFTAPYKLAYSTPGAKLDTYLTLSAGTYNTVIQEWDNCGWSASVPITITVGSGGTPSGGTAGVFSNLQSSPWWNGYVLLRTSGYNICLTCTPSGPLATWSTQQGIKSPALSSGGSMKFNIGGTFGYSDILWNVKFTKHLADEKSVPNFHNFTYDVWFFGTNLELSEALEFDINQFINGKSFIWGHECRIAGGHEWDTWDNRGFWVKSGIGCHPVSNVWNHLIIKVQRTWDNRLLFQSINLNGNVSTLNRYDNPTPTTWYGMTINYQMDGNSLQQAYSVYLDKVNFSYY
jgi:hypothetical protein